MKVRDLINTVMGNKVSLQLKSTSSNVTVKIMNPESIKEIQNKVKNNKQISAHELEVYLGSEPKSNIHAATLMKMVNDHKSTDKSYTI